MLSYHHVVLCTSLCTCKVYAHLINLVMLNCHILHRDSRGLERKDEASGFHRVSQFKVRLPWTRDTPWQSTVPVECEEKNSKDLHDNVNRVKGFHELTVLKGTMGGPNIRKTRIWCNQKGIMTVCKQCNVPVCSDDGCGNDSCSFSFHNAPAVCNLPYSP